MTCAAAAIVLALVGACSLEPQSVAPSPDEVSLRALGPADVRRRDELEPACKDALADADAKLEGPRDEAEAAIDEAEARCGDGMGTHWRRGLVAKRARDHDAAAKAFAAELRGPSPVPIAGVHLMEVLPHSSARTQRATARRGRRFDATGLAGLGPDRVAMAVCGGRPAAMIHVACSRDPPQCDYLYRCEGGGRRHVVVASAELWFDLQ